MGRTRAITKECIDRLMYNISSKCECGAITFFCNRRDLLSEIVRTFLNSRNRGITCVCGKIRKAEVSVLHTDSWDYEHDEPCCYNVHDNAWLDTSDEYVCLGQPSIISVELAFSTILSNGHNYLESKVQHDYSIYNKMIFDRKRAKQQRIPLSRKKQGTFYMKPWKDPESLFCSPKLKEILGKELRDGDECKDKDNDKDKNIS